MAHSHLDLVPLKQVVTTTAPASNVQVRMCHFQVQIAAVVTTCFKGPGENVPFPGADY